MSTGQTESASVRKIRRFGPGKRLLQVVGSAWAVGLVLSMALMYGTAFAAVATSQETKCNPPSVPSAEKMVPNGEYEIYVFTQDKWQKAGKAACDRYFRERELDLGRFLSSNRETRIKIIQKGGGAAHIDSVFLGGAPPVSVEGIENGVKKLAKQDYDVADAFGKEMVVTFPKGTKDGILRLTARMENTTISTTPFQFPPDNLYKKMESGSAFYTYRMNAGNALSPVFKEHSLTGSGHPSGYTYGWARNDEKNLYVKIDFTADNTMDGDKDYAKVYVKTRAGLKEFKVSVPETKWGSAEFTYTDNVPYQHKVYDFTIPLKELGIADAKKEKELLLAFATYGTASPPAPAGYSADSKRYLVVFDSAGDIYGRLVDVSGSAVGSDFVISNAANNQASPSVAYDSVNHRYLVSWTDYRDNATRSSDIYGQFVNMNGTLSGGNFIISNATTLTSQQFPKIAFDSANEMYLVVWTDERTSGTTSQDIYGQLVDAGGTFQGSNFVISNAASYQDLPDVAYDSVNLRYLVVWRDSRSSAITGTDVYGQLVNANGSLNGGNFIISNATGAQDMPAIAYDSVNQQYLAVWIYYHNSKYVVYGQFVNADGTLNDATPSNLNFPISSASYNTWYVSLAFDSARQRYLVAWSDDRNFATADTDIYGQFVNANGSLFGGDFPVTQAASTQYSTATAYNSSCGNFLVTFRDCSAGCGIQQAVVGSCSRLFGTVGFGKSDNWNGYCSDETCYYTSYLIELNPDSGAITKYVGEVGYYVNGLAYDPTTNKLYGGTNKYDPGFNGLIEINTATGAGTRAGAANWGAVSATPITNITINTAGQIYGWSQDYDSLVSIDKTTGVATVVGESGFTFENYGLSFNSADELYLVNNDGRFYSIEKDTGATAYVGQLSSVGSMWPHHGDFDPLTDFFYDITFESSGPRNVLKCDLSLLTDPPCTMLDAVDNLHTLAFEHKIGTEKFTLTIHKAGAGAGMVTSRPAGIKCGTDCSQDYFSGTSVKLIDIADADSTFAGWTGEGCSSGTVAMYSARDCTATFDPKPSYTVTYDGNGSTGGTVPTDSTAYHTTDTVTVLENNGNLVKTGCTFAGWNTAANGSGAGYNGGQTFPMGSGNVTLYAQWAEITYTVTYNGNGSTGGTVPTDSIAYHITDTVIVLGNTGSLVRTGYTFAGWNTASNGGGTGYTGGDTFPMGGNVTLYAKWTAITYTVSFDSQGGSAVNSQAVDYDGLVTEPTAPTRTGHTFAGWYKEAAGTNAWNFTSDTVTGAMTLYAKWTAITYTVSFDSQGGSALNSQTVAYGGLVTEPTAPTRTGHTFAGWYKEAAGTNAWNFTSDTVTGATTLYAKWTAINYTVTYNGNGSTGGTVPTDSTIYHITDTVIVLGNTGSLVRTGYTFAGWNTTSTGSGTSYNGGDTFPMGSSNVTLYAKWTALAPVITAHPGSQEVAAGESVTFTATASGSPTPAVHWQMLLPVGGRWTNIRGATSTTYFFTAQAADHGKQYRAVFTNAAGTATTNPATLTIKEADVAITDNGSTYNPTAKTITWKLYLVNNGSTAAQGVVVTDNLANGTRASTVNVSGGSYKVRGRTVTVSIPTLAPGAGASVTIDIEASVGKLTGSITNTATVTTATPDSNGANNTVTASVSVP